MRAGNKQSHRSAIALPPVLRVVYNYESTGQRSRKEKLKNSRRRLVTRAVQTVQEKRKSTLAFPSSTSADCYPPLSWNLSFQLLICKIVYLICPHTHVIYVCDFFPLLVLVLPHFTIFSIFLPRLDSVETYRIFKYFFYFLRL